MRLTGWCLALLAGASISFGAGAEDLPKQEPPSGAGGQSSSAQGLPEWAPGPLAEKNKPPVEGRVAARYLGVAFTLPVSWRADDVTWRELDATDSKSINPMAEFGLLVELAEGGSKVPLLTLYRVPLEAWRAADRTGTAKPGRLTLIDRDKAFIVVRPADATGPGRFATLRKDLDDAIGTLALFDAHHEERHLMADIGSHFVGTQIDGRPLSLHLESGGNLKLSIGKQPREFSGRWLQRGAQIIGHLVDPGEGVNPALLFHFDGKGLIVIKWDEKVFGNLGGRLDKPE